MIAAFAVAVAVVLAAAPTPRARSFMAGDSVRLSPLTSVGAAVRRRGGRALPSLVRVTDRTLGIVAVVLLVLVVVAPPVAAGVAFGVVATAVRRERLVARRRTASLLRTLPDVVDQLALAVAAGLPTLASLRIVAPRLPSVWAEPFTNMLERVDQGAGLADALTWLADRTDPIGRPFFRLLIAAQRDGTPLAAGLERAADEARRAHRREIEARARRLPVVLLLPLVVCVLPAFVLLTLVPLVAGSLSSLSGTFG